MIINTDLVILMKNVLEYSSCQNKHCPNVFSVNFFPLSNERFHWKMEVGTTNHHSLKFWQV